MSSSSDLLITSDFSSITDLASPTIISDSSTSTFFSGVNYTVLTSTLYYTSEPTSTSASQSFTVILSTSFGLSSTNDSELSTETSTPSPSFLNANGTGNASSSAQSTDVSHSRRLAIIIGLTLGLSLICCLLVGCFCHQQRKRRNATEKAQLAGVANPARAYMQRGRRRRHDNALSKEIQETDEAALSNAMSAASRWPAINPTLEFVGRQSRGSRWTQQEPTYDTSSRISTPPSLLLPRQRPSSSNSSSHPSSSQEEPRENPTAISVLDTTSTGNNLGHSSPSITSTERRALRQLTLPESWGSQVSKMEMSLEQKRAQEKFLILPEPAYSAEGINGIRGLRAPSPTGD